MTDILGSNRVGLDAILVRCLKRKSEKWYTKLNRRREMKVLKALEEKYNDKIKNFALNKFFSFAGDRIRLNDEGLIMMDFVLLKLL